jgi:hypothetical protein
MCGNGHVEIIISILSKHRIFRPLVNMITTVVLHIRKCVCQFSYSKFIFKLFLFKTL